MRAFYRVLQRPGRCRPRFFRKAAASALLLSFAFQSTAPAAFPAPVPADPGSISAPWIRDAVPDFPASVATVEDAYRAPGSSRTIVLLQDAHTNNSGQMNVARSLDLLFRKTPVRHVFLEAGSGNESLSFLRRFAPLSVRTLIAKSYLSKGQLQGSEYLDLTSEHAFTLWGVEDPALYARSLDAYRAVVRNREALRAFLAKMRDAVEALKPDIYNPFLLAFDEKARGFAKDSVPLSDYSDALAAEARRLGLPLEAYPSLAVLGRLRVREAAIDFAKADAQQRTALASLPEAEQRDLFLSASDAHAASKFSAGDHAAQNGFFAALGARFSADRALYPELFKYLDYLEEAGKLRAPALLEEQKALEKKIYAALAETPDEKALVSAAETVDALEGLAELALTPAEFSAHFDGGAAAGVVRIAAFLNGRIMDRGVHYEKAVFLDRNFDAGVARCEEFYALTAARDEAFVRNLTRKMDEGGERTAVLVAGGYHGPNLKALFRRRGISYVSVVPRVTQETNRKRYEELLLKQELDARVSGSFLLPSRGHMMLGRIGGWDPLHLWTRFEADLVEEPRRAEAEAARLARSVAPSKKAAARLALPADALSAVKEWKESARPPEIPSPLHVPARINFFVTTSADKGWANAVTDGDGLYGKALPPLRLSDGRSIVPVVGDLHDVTSIEVEAGLHDPASLTQLDAAHSRLQELTRIETAAVPDQALHPGLVRLFGLDAGLAGYPHLESVPDYDSVEAVGAETLKSLLWILHEKNDREFLQYLLSRRISFEALLALPEAELRESIPGYYFWRADQLHWDDYYKQKTANGAAFPYPELAARRYSGYPKEWMKSENRDSPYFEHYRFDRFTLPWFREYQKLADYLDVRTSFIRTPYTGRSKKLEAPPSLETASLQALLGLLHDRKDPVLAFELSRLKKTYEEALAMPRRELMGLGLVWSRAEEVLWNEFYEKNKTASGVEDLKARRDALIASDEVLRTTRALVEGLVKANESLKVRVNVKRLSDEEIRVRFGLERVTGETGRPESMDAVTFRDVVGRLAFLYGPWGVVEARSPDGSVTTVDSQEDFLGALVRGDMLSFGKGRFDVKAFGTIAPKVYKFEDHGLTVLSAPDGSLRPSFQFGLLAPYLGAIAAETQIVFDDGAGKRPVSLRELLANPGVIFGTRYQPGFPSPAGTEVTGFSGKALEDEKYFARLGATGPYHTFSRFLFGDTKGDRPPVAGSLRLTREDGELSMRVYEALAEYDADRENSLIGRWKAQGVLNEKLEEFFGGVGDNYFGLFALGKTLVNMGTGRYIHMGTSNIPPLQLSYDFFVKNVDLVRGRPADLGDYMSLDESINDVWAGQDTAESVTVLTALVGELLSDLEKKGLTVPADRPRFFRALAKGFTHSDLADRWEMPDDISVNSIAVLKNADQAGKPSFPKFEAAPDANDAEKDVLAAANAMNRRREGAMNTRAPLSVKTEKFIGLLEASIAPLIEKYWKSETVYYDTNMQASVVRRFRPDLEEGSPYYDVVLHARGQGGERPRGSEAPIAGLLREARRQAGYRDAQAYPVTVEPNRDDAVGTTDNRAKVAEEQARIRKMIRKQALGVDAALDKARDGKQLTASEEDFLTLVKALDAAFRTQSGTVRIGGEDVSLEDALARLNDARARLGPVSASPQSGARLAVTAETALTARGEAFDDFVAAAHAKPGDRLALSDADAGPWVLSFAEGRSTHTVDVSADGRTPFHTVDLSRRPPADRSARAVSDAVMALRDAERKFDRRLSAAQEKKPIEIYLHLDGYAALPEALQKSLFASQFGALAARKADYRAVHLVGSPDIVRRALEIADGLRSLRAKRALFVEGDAPRFAEAKQIHVVAKDYFLANEKELRRDPARRFITMDDVRYDGKKRTMDVTAFNPVFSLVEMVGVMDGLSKDDGTFAPAYEFFKAFTGYTLTEDDFIGLLGGEPGLVARFALPPVIRAIDVNLALRVWAMGARMAGQSA